MYKIYTDGAYSNKRNQGGCAFVILKDDKIIAQFSKAYKNTTNNRMEMLAVILALESIKKSDKIIIYSDSMYVIGTATLNWQRRKNLDLWNRFDKIVGKYSIDWQHVKGHANNEYNNLCDRLAVHASHIQC